MKFSVIMPVYNVESYLEKAINSIVDQPFNDYELILIDDGSTDGSGIICDDYNNKYLSVNVIHQKNRGLSGARNTGIKYAQGDYLIFVDSDDWLFDDSLSVLSQILESNKPDVIINRIFCYDDINQTLKECAYKFSPKSTSMASFEILDYCYRLPGFWAAAWMLTCKREYIIENDLYFVEGIYHEDIEWFPRVMLNAKIIAFNNNCIYVNRANRSGSIIATPNIKKELDKLTIIDLLINESKKSNYELAASKLIKSRCSSIYSGVLQNTDMYSHTDNFNDLKSSLTKRYKVLLYSHNFMHLLLFLICLLLGPKITSKIINSFKIKG